MVSCATCVSFLLPSVQSAIYFHRQVSPIPNDNCIASQRSFRNIQLSQPEPELLEPVLLEEKSPATRTNFSPSIRQKWTRAGKLISKWVNAIFVCFINGNTFIWSTLTLALVFRDFLSAFTSPYILKWSIWWALAMCGNYQVVFFPFALSSTKHQSISSGWELHPDSVEWDQARGGGCWGECSLLPSEALPST